MGNQFDVMSKASVLLTMVLLISDSSVNPIIVREANGIVQSTTNQALP